MTQLLRGLDSLSIAGIIHCDLKPENILLVDNRSSLKIIDFGSACFENQSVYSYIQSRFYRSPEVILGIKYNSAIDIWSLGCICFELFYGLPLFPGQNEHRMLMRITQGLGCDPPNGMLNCGNNTLKYYQRCSDHNSNMWSYKLKTDEQYASDEGINEIPPFRDYFNKATYLDDIVMGYPYKSTLTKEEIDEEKRLRRCMLHMLKLMLRWDPEERYHPSDLLNHPFITGKSIEDFIEKPRSSPIPNKRRARSESFGFTSQNPSPEKDGTLTLGVSPGSYFGSYGYMTDPYTHAYGSFYPSSSYNDPNDYPPETF